MHTIFNQLAAVRNPYNWERGPKQVRSAEDAREGLNCVALAHLALKDLANIQLPSALHCFEMFRDMRSVGDFFRPVAGGVQNMIEGDIVWLGHQASDRIVEGFTPDYDNQLHLRNNRAFPLRHLALYTGEMDTETGHPLMFHTSRETGIEIAPLPAIMEWEPHEQIHGIGRLIVPYNKPGETL